MITSFDYLFVAFLSLFLKIYTPLPIPHYLTHDIPTIHCSNRSVWLCIRFARDVKPHITLIAHITLITHTYHASKPLIELSIAAACKGILSN